MKKYLSLEGHDALKREEIQKGAYLPDPAPTRVQAGSVLCPKCHVPLLDTLESKTEDGVPYRKTACISCGKSHWRIA